MPVVETDLRFTREKAKKLRYYPKTPLTVPATNVQDAIDEVQANVVVVSTSPPALTPKTITFAMSPYTILATDYFLLVDTTGGAVSIQTAASASRGNRSVIIKDSGNAAVNAISILRTAAETIDGMTSYPIDSAFDEVTLQPITGGYAVTK